MSRTAEDLATNAHSKERPLVVHVSGDFPDPIQPFKTPVIRQLVALTSDSFDHHVISINRASPSLAASARMMAAPGKLAIESTPFEYGTALLYTAPGKGLRHMTMLEQLGSHIALECSKLPRKPDLIVGHKLTIEGIAVRKAAGILGVPYALSIQGNTDTKIMAARPDLKGHFADIFHEARTVFPFAPWAQRKVEKALGERADGVRILPCPTELDQPMRPRNGGNGMISVFHLKNWEAKNLKGMVKAWKILAAHGEPPPLEIIGGGSEEELQACRAQARDVPQITFAGPMGRDDIAERMNSATAMIMPSMRESFGLVFIEALFAGAPIIYPKGSAVDGFFDNASFALGVDPNSPQEIAKAVERATHCETDMKSAIAEWHHSSEAKRFTRDEIALVFERGLNQAIGH